VHFPGSFPLLPCNPISLEVLQINQQPLPFFSAAFLSLWLLDKFQPAGRRLLNLALERQ